MALFRRVAPPALRHLSSSCFGPGVRLAFVREFAEPTALRKLHKLSANVRTFTDVTVEPSRLNASEETVIDASGSSQGAHTDHHVVSVPQTGSLISKILVQISTYVNQAVQSGTVDKLWEDPYFVKSAMRLHDVVTQLTAGQLIDAASLLLRTAPAMDPFQLQSVENQIRWMIRRMTASQLIRVLQIFSQPSTPSRRLVYDDTMSSIERRWVEIATGQELITLYLLVPPDMQHFLERLDDRALELAQSLSVKELYRILYILARHKRRSAPLIRSLVHHLKHRTLDLSPIHLSNLAFALSSLHIFDPVLMSKISSAVGKITETAGPVSTPSTAECGAETNTITILSSLLQSFGLMRWKDTALMDTVAAYFMRNRSAVTPTDWQRLIVTSAWIDHLPAALSGEPSDLPDICRWMENAVRLADPLGWLDVVWSCSLLSRITPEMAVSVLRPEFISTIEKTIQTQMSTAFAKLLNINSVVQSTLSGYKGPLLSQDYIEVALTRIPPRGRGKLFETVVATLSQIAPADQYLQTNVQTPSGHFIDVLMLLNKKAEPVQWPEQGTSLPPDVNKVAIQVLDFSDMTLGITQPNGVMLSTARMLSLAGYKVVEVPYTEFDVTQTVVQRVQYLHPKLKSVIVPDDNPNSLASAEKSTTSPPIRPTRAARETTPKKSPKSPVTPNDSNAEQKTPKSAKSEKSKNPTGKSKMEMKPAAETEASPTQIAEKKKLKTDVRDFLKKMPADSDGKTDN